MDRGAEAFRAFMEALIDYAGLFPPASLAMPASVQEYARVRRLPEAWMLGRFIVPAGRLAELADCLAELPGSELPWRLAVIVEADDRKIVAATDAMRRVEDQAAGRLVIDSVETRVPASVLATDDEGALRQFVGGFETRLAEAGFMGLPVSFEAAGAEEKLSAVLRPATPTGKGRGRGERTRLPSASSPPRYGLKLRCGGPRLEDVPSAERVAAVIADCAAFGLTLKLTAGLHHPLRGSARPPGAGQHGFLNVVGAGVLSACQRLDRASSLACLRDEDAASFRFDGGFAWRDRTATPVEIAAARRELMVAFGSCSFSEPLDDLRALGFGG